MPRKKSLDTDSQLRDKQIVLLDHRKADDCTLWYLEALDKSEIADTVPTSFGCYVLRPWGFAIWEALRTVLGPLLAKVG